MKDLPAKEGYSVYAPLSRQEKGVDLLVTRRLQGNTRAAALQIKYSRAFEQPEGAPFQFGTLFRAFPVSDRADFFILAALYPNITGRGGGTRASWWKSLLLVLRREKMAELISSLRTQSGTVDRMFYFGFDSPSRVVLTRGAPGKSEEERDYSSFTFAAQLPILKQYLGAT